MNSQKTNNVTAIILAGGQGSRMGYVDKAWLTYQGKPLIKHVLDRIEHQVERIIISRNHETPEYEKLGLTCIKDGKDESLGPLSGILACSREISTPLALIVPCDTPHLPEDLLSRLETALDPHDVAVAKDSTHLQHLVFLARAEKLTSIAGYLDKGKRSVRGWIETTDYVPVSFEDESPAFENINETGQLK